MHIIHSDSYKQLNKMAESNLQQQLMNLRPEFAKAAQKIYDDWIVTDPIDDELNGGGICHLIADAIADVIHKYIPNASVGIVDSQGVGDQHVWVCTYDHDACYDVDISPYLYEKGAGHSWKKIPNVTFEPSDVNIMRQRHRPTDF